MDPETRNRIFEPFFTTKEKDRGTGLGMATSYGIVKQHGGSIRVCSEPGLGTVFRVYLPLVAESGRDALEILHLLLTDVIMPEMNGRELADRVCADDPDVKVLFMSCYSSEDIIRRGILEKDARFIRKPLSVHTLAARVREVLDEGMS